MSNVAADQLRQLIERVERIEEEIASMNADKSDIYKEARGLGFDVKAMRKVVAKRKLDADDRDEQDAMFELYWNAVHGLVQVHTGARENIDEFNPETGEVYERDSEQHIGPTHGEQRHAPRVSGTLGRREGDDEGNQGQGSGVAGTDRGAGRVSGTVDRQDEDGRSRHVGGEAHHEVTESPRKAAEAVPERAANNPVANVGEGAQAKTGGASNDPASRASEVSERQRASMVGFTGAGEAASTVLPTDTEAAGTRPIPSVRSTTPSEQQRDTLGVTIVGTESGTVFQHKEYILRPHCQKPGQEDCGGVGSRHCYSCEKLMREREAA